MGAEYISGPWNLYKGEDGDVIGVRRYVESDSGGTVAKDVCTMPLPNLRPVHKNMLLTQAEVNATGHLIAAAPELLEALQILMAAQTEYDYRRATSVYERIEEASEALLYAKANAEAAIKKATTS